jgi:hypothetical protein
MKRTWMPTAAGILCLVGGGINLAFGLLGILIWGLLLAGNYVDSNELTFAFGWVIAVSIIGFIFSAVAVAGGIYALKRRLWGLSLAGAICITLTWWWFIPGITAIILLVLSKNEFDNVPPDRA